MPRRNGLSSLGYIAALLALGYAAFAYKKAEPLGFYISLFAGAVFLNIGLWNSTKPIATTAARTLLILAAMLPVADYILKRPPSKPAAEGEARPVYTFREAKGDPGAFAAWWSRYTRETIGTLEKIQKPDPEGRLPYLFVENEKVNFFESVVRINNLGFRGPDIDSKRKDVYRILVLGESAVFNPNIKPDRPFTESLAEDLNSKLSCARPIEVINDGSVAYNLKDNLDRLQRQLPVLKPAMVVSYHGYNGLKFIDNRGKYKMLVRPDRNLPRASRLTAALEYAIRARISALAEPLSAGPIPHEWAMHSEYARLYNKLIDMSKTSGFKLVLANASMAVDTRSPEEVKEFYTQAFQDMKWCIQATKAHNEMVKELAEVNKIPFIDTTPGFSGEWDADYFLDPVHFTSKGGAKMEQILFDHLAPLLRNDPTLGCH